MEEKYGISFTLLEAYSFRHIFQIIQKEKPKNICFIFRDDSFLITGESETGTTIISISVDCTKLGEYIYSINPDVSEDSEDYISEYPITINYDQMYSALCQVGIKDGASIMWYLGDNFLTVKILKNSSDQNDSGGSRVNIIENPGFFFEDIYSEEESPNINVLVDSFCDQCKKISTHKCSSLKIIGRKKFLLVKGYDLQEVERFDCKFESSIKAHKKLLLEPPATPAASASAAPAGSKKVVPGAKKIILLKKKVVPEEEDLITVEINEKIAKVYTKIKNIAPKKGFISFYYSNNEKAMKIEFAIGVYGTYKIFIR